MIFDFEFVTVGRGAEDAFYAVEVDKEGAVAADDVSAGFELVFQCGEGGAED